MKRKGFTLIELLIVLAMILIVVLMAAPGLLKVMNQREVTVTVTDKWVKNNGDGGKYLVSTSEGVYEVTDSFFKWRWDSSDTYARLEVGEDYTMEVGGIRVPFFSLYPNIYDVRPAE